MTHTSLVVALAQAHRALLDSLGAHTAPKSAAATLAKLDNTLAEAVDGLNLAVAERHTAQEAENAAKRAKDPHAYVHTVRYPDEARAAVINAGSRKALERLPLYTGDPLQPMRSIQVDTAFVLRQTPAYAKAAMKRGMGIDDRTKLDILRGIAGVANTEPSHGRSSPIAGPVALPTTPAFFTEGKVGAGFAAQALIVALQAAQDKRAAVAPIVAAIWKTALKERQTEMEAAFARLAVLHDPALAGPHTAQGLVAHALVGTKRPQKDQVEHAAVEAAIAAMTGASGRKALLAEVGDMAAWIAHGAPLPQALASFERARQSYRPNTRRTGWF